MVTIVLYSVWLLLPLTFLTLALWARLERASGNTRGGTISDYLHQAFFCSACIAVAVILDQNVLADFVPSIFGDWLPLTVARVLLLPALLLLSAKIFGGSKVIRIDRTAQYARPRPRSRRRR